MKKVNIYGLLFCAAVSTATLWSCAEDVDTVVSPENSNVMFSVDHVENVLEKVPVVTAKELQKMNLPATAIGAEALQTKEGHTDILISEVTTPRMPIDAQTLSSRAVFREGVNEMFKVWGFSQNSNRPDIMNGNRVSNVGTLMDGASWNPTGGNAMARFTAIYPGNAEGLTVQSNYDERAPKISFKVHNDVTKQSELMWAVKDYTYDNNAQRGTQVVPLLFYHALTAVRFKVGRYMPAGATLLSVKFKGVYSKGDYSPIQAHNASNSGNGWSNLSGNNGAEGEFALENLSIPLGQREGDIILGKPDGSDAYTFLMIPQTLPSGAALELVIRKQTSRNTWENVQYTVDLSGKKWVAGTVKTYNITEPDDPYEYTFARRSAAVNANDNQLAPGTNAIIAYDSYRVDKITREIEYLPIYVADMETQTDPEYRDWLYTNMEGPHQNVANIMLNPSYVYDVTEFAKDKLKNAPYKGILFPNNSNSPEEYYNLAANGSANSYIITSKGSYVIPLVYGNSLKKSGAFASHGVSASQDEVNPSAYTIDGAYPFIDGLGNQIGSANVMRGNIAEGVYLKDVALVDVVGLDNNSPSVRINGLLTGTQLGYSELGNRIMAVSFKVTAEEAKNVLLQAKNSAGDIIWQYHLWISPEPIVGNRTYPKKYKRNSGDKMSIMPSASGEGAIFDENVKYQIIDKYMQAAFGEVPLGWIGTSGLVLRDREHLAPTKLKFRQERRLEDRRADNEEEIWLIPSYSYDLQGYAPQYLSGLPWPYLNSALVSTYKTGDPYGLTDSYESVETFDLQTVLKSGSKKLYLSDKRNNPNWFPDRSLKSINYWDARPNSARVEFVKVDDRIIKTVYDPTPQGFHAPNEPEAVYVNMASVINTPSITQDKMFGINYISPYYLKNTSAANVNHVLKGTVFYMPTYNIGQGGIPVNKADNLNATTYADFIVIPNMAMGVYKRSDTYMRMQNGNARFMAYRENRKQWTYAYIDVSNILDTQFQVADLGYRTGVLPLLKYYDEE